jgi:hypothetical protein
MFQLNASALAAMKFPEYPNFQIDVRKLRRDRHSCNYTKHPRLFGSVIFYVVRRLPPVAVRSFLRR